LSEIHIQRKTRQYTWTLGTATASAAVLRMEDMAGGVVSVGTMVTAAVSLQCFGSVTESGPYGRVYDSSGAAADITLAPSTAERRLYSLPDAVYGVPYLLIVSGTTNSTGTVAVVSLKS
jgi:hypothetical protein